MTHRRAVLLFHKKFEYADGEIVEVKAWAVTPPPFEVTSIEQLSERFTQEVAHLRRRMT